jgi:hypothetical protein
MLNMNPSHSREERGLNPSMMFNTGPSPTLWESPRKIRMAEKQRPAFNVSRSLQDEMNEPWVYIAWNCNRSLISSCSSPLAKTNQGVVRSDERDTVRWTLTADGVYFASIHPVLMKFSSLLRESLDPSCTMFGRSEQSNSNCGCSFGTGIGLQIDWGLEAGLIALPVVSAIRLTIFFVSHFGNLCTVFSLL